MQAVLVAAGVAVFAVLVGTLAAGIWARFGCAEDELMAMGVCVGQGGASAASRRPRNRRARSARRVTIDRIESLAAEHSILVPRRLELCGMRTVELGKELVRVERIAGELLADRARARGVGRDAGHVLASTAIAG